MLMIKLHGIRRAQCGNPGIFNNENEHHGTMEFIKNCGTYESSIFTPGLPRPLASARDLAMTEFSANEFIS